MKLNKDILIRELGIEVVTLVDPGEKGVPYVCEEPPAYCEFISFLVRHTDNLGRVRAIAENFRKFKAPHKNQIRYCFTHKGIRYAIPKERLIYAWYMEEDVEDWDYVEFIDNDLGLDEKYYPTNLKLIKGEPLYGKEEA